MKRGQQEQGYYKKKWRGRIPIDIGLPNEYAVGRVKLLLINSKDRVSEKFPWDFIKTGVKKS
jgi:hypothetical protein